MGAYLFNFIIMAVSLLCCILNVFQWLRGKKGGRLVSAIICLAIFIAVIFITVQGYYINL